VSFLASLFITKPLNILAVAFVFLAGYIAQRFKVLSFKRNTHPMLIAAIAWGLYAAWEWLVLVKTPEANIRADLLAIWPVLAILSAWALFRTIR
jgi:hypothetical protein